MTLKVVHNLVEQGLTNPVKIDAAGDRRPPKVEMRNRLLKRNTFELIIAFHNSGRLKPSRRSCLLKDPSD